MEVTYSGTMRCPHCGHKNVNPIVLATNDDDTTLQCYSCSKDFEPSDELRWREIPEAVLERCADSVWDTLHHHNEYKTILRCTKAILAAAHYAELVAENESLKKRCENAGEAMLEELKKVWLESAGPKDGAFVLSMRSGLVPLLADMVADDFKRAGGRNYVSVDMLSEELGPLTMTVQRKEGKTPAEINAELLNQAAALKTALQACLSWMDGIGASPEEFAHGAPVYGDVRQFAREALKKAGVTV